MDKSKNISTNLFATLIKDDIKFEKKEWEEEIKELLFRYVDNCPCKKGSVNSKKFKDYGVVKNYQFSKLKKSILSKINKDCYKLNEPINKENIEEIHNNNLKETIIFNKGEFGELDSLFIKIGNSFAHGNYFVKKKLYILWNDNGKNINSFMILSYVSLINIFKSLENFSKYKENK